jgi:hypothetical protein
MLAVAHTARAQEPTFEALGQASVVGGDRVRARERALDEAMRQAVEQAVATLLEPKALTDRAGQLKLNVYPRARGFVSTYRVLDEGGDGPIFQLRIEATVDTARLAKAVQAPQAVTPTVAPKAKAVVCITEDRPPAPSGPSPTEKTIIKALGNRSVEANGLAGQCPDSLDDAHAGAAARKELAQAALIGHLKLTSDGAVRGTPLLIGRAQGRFHLVDPDGRSLAAVDANGEAYDAAPAAALDAAAAQAVDNALHALGPRLASRWPAGGPVASGVTVHVAGLARWSEYSALLRMLAAIPGVAGVSPRKFDTGGVDLQLHTSTSAQSIAAAISRSGDTPDGPRFAAEPMGDLELKVRITSPPPPTEAPPPVSPPG